MQVEYGFDAVLKELTPEFVVGEEYFQSLTSEQCEKDYIRELAYRTNKMKKFLAERKADRHKSAFLLNDLETSIKETFQFENWYRGQTSHTLSDLPVEVGDEMFLLYHLYSRPYPNKKEIKGNKIFLKEMYITRKEIDYMDENFICVMQNKRENFCFFVNQDFPLFYLLGLRLYQKLKFLMDNMHSGNHVMMFIPDADMVHTQIILN